LGVVKHWSRLPHSWKHSRSGWTGFWATWSSWRCHCSLQDSWTRWSRKIPPNPNYSMILCFSSVTCTGFHRFGAV